MREQADCDLSRGRDVVVARPREVCMRILMGFVFLTASGPLLAQNASDVCAVDLDCRGTLVCVQNACVPRPEEKKSADGKPVSTPPLSRVEVALAPEVGV